MSESTIQQKIKEACQNNRGITLSITDVRMLYDALFYGQWVSVEDALPEDGEEVITADCVMLCTYEGGDFYNECYEHDTGHIYSESVDVKYWAYKGERK